jgi:hypothetical protein
VIVGRPLRFLGLIVGGWIAMRVTILWWPVDAAPLRGVQPLATALPVSRAPASRSGTSSRLWSGVAKAQTTGIVSNKRGTRLAIAVSTPETAATSRVADAPETGIIAGLPARAPMPSRQVYPTRSRLAGTFWLVARGGSGPPGGVLGAQLGGSQAGARLTYALTNNRRLAIAARASTPLGPGAQELALGLEWQPTRLPVRVIAEQRIPLNGGRGGPTLGLVGGFGPQQVAAGFALEGYAQGGVIARDAGEGFADGAARLARPVAHLGKVSFDLGVGTWGAAQKGATRIDLGPSLVAHVPLADQPIRLSLDWRQRVAGNAKPDSGLVLTLGADF